MYKLNIFRYQTGRVNFIYFYRHMNAECLKSTWPWNALLIHVGKCRVSALWHLGIWSSSIWQRNGAEFRRYNKAKEAKTHPVSICGTMADVLHTFIRYSTQFSLVILLIEILIVFVMLGYAKVSAALRNLNRKRICSPKALRKSKMPEIT